MKNIRISDLTVGNYASNETVSLTFREKVEVSKLLDRLCVSVIELGKMSSGMGDNLLVKTVASSVSGSTLAVCPGFGKEAVAAAWEALKGAAKPRLQVCAALSVARMEYVYHMKAADMQKAAVENVKECRKYCDDVEFIAEDAARANFEFLCNMLGSVIEAGASTVTLCDTAGVMLPDEFAAFLSALRKQVPELEKVSLAVRCSNGLNMADACCIAALAQGADELKVSAMDKNEASLANIAGILAAKGESLNACCSVKTTEINRVLQSIGNFLDKADSSKSPFDDGVRTLPADMVFTANDSPEEIQKGAAYLGYDLSPEDQTRIWKAFCVIAQRKDQVSLAELEAIIATEAMQVPATYVLENFMITTGNAVDIIAHVKLKKGEDVFDGLSLGDGPIDAAFLAIEKITGHHYELDDFQIQAITEGREAVGQTIVKLRSMGKVYSGRGTSTDIVCSAIAAYVNALNKILYEEENK